MAVVWAEAVLVGGGGVVSAATELSVVEEGIAPEALVEIVVSTPPGNKQTLEGNQN